ncbi:MAG: hypothetical protein IJW94_02240 [Oscillospiraceae bacterium]|nr:hypothetical protein [Oscillospiraceae bacterium]
MLSKRSKARIIRMLIILGVVLALAVTGIVIAVNQLLAGQKAQNGMPENSVIYLHEQADGTIRMEWTAGVNADSYTVEITRMSNGESLFSHTTEKRSCTLSDLPRNERLTIRVRSGAAYQGKIYPGSRDLLVNVKLDPPVISDVEWEINPDTDVLELKAIMNSDVACRMQFTDAQGVSGDVK